MDLDEIQRNVGLWARSAAMAREAGYDGVEVSVVHGYFLHQFLSPLYNRREDAYGGNLDGRMRLPREVVAAVREAVGTDYVVGVRLVLADFLDRGLEVEEGLKSGAG